MVNRIFNYFNKEIGGLHQAAYLLGLFAFLSQLLALVRDRLLAHSFGAGADLDLYYAAFRIPDFIFVAVASLVSLSVLIPLLSERLEGGVERGRQFLSTVFTFFLLVMLTMCAAAFLLVPWLLHILFPGFSDYTELITLTRILLLSPIFLGLSSLFGSITQIHKRFFVYATSPLLYNIGIIIGILVFMPHFGLKGVAIGVALGALMHMLVQVPSIVGLGLMPRLELYVPWKDIVKIIKLSLPRTIALSVTQISILFLLSIASLMREGSIAVFNLSYNLQSVTLSIIGVSYSLAAFPTLIQLYSRGDRKEFMEHMLTSARHIIFWSVPAAVLFIVLRAHIVRVILGSGHFTWSDTRLTAAALGLFMISAVFQGLVLLFVRGYYSAGNTRKPLIVNVFSGACIVFFSVILTHLFANFETFRFFIEALFRVDGIPGTEVLMLPLGFTLGSIVNGVVLWVLFHFDFKGFSAELFKTLIHSLGASVFAGTASYAALFIFDQVFDNNTFIGVFLQGFLAGIIGIMVGILVLLSLKNRELKEIWIAFHRKFWKAKPLSPDPNVTA